MKQLVKSMWSILKISFSDFIEKRVLKLSAALAFYTIFSLPAMLIIIISISDVFYGREVIEGSLYHQISNFVGVEAARQLQQTIHSSSLSPSNNFALVVGLITLLVGATSVFSEIQDSINFIWKLKAKPREGSGIIRMLFNRLLSFSIVVSLGFLLLVSLMINGVMDVVVQKLTVKFPEVTAIMVYMVNHLLSFGITALLFGMIFKILPDANLQWKHVFTGTIITTVLFMAGKFLISYYLGHSALSSVYGTAGSAIVMLLWVYYTAMILYYGAVFTHVYAVQRGSHIYPNSYAVNIKEIEVESENAIQEQPQSKIVIEVPEKPGAGPAE